MSSAVLGFENTSSLVDLLLSPHGSSPLYQVSRCTAVEYYLPLSAQSLVPSQHQESSAQEKMDELENHLVSHGLNQVEFEAGRRTIHVRVCCP